MIGSYTLRISPLLSSQASGASLISALHNQGILTLKMPCHLFLSRYGVKETKVDQSLFQIHHWISPGLRTEYLRKEVHRGDLWLCKYWHIDQAKAKEPTFETNKQTNTIKAGELGNQPRSAASFYVINHSNFYAMLFGWILENCTLLCTVDWMWVMPIFEVSISAIIWYWHWIEELQDRMNLVCFGRNPIFK